MSNFYIVKSDELYHYGVKGMKWGVRRYQNPDGSLTISGKKRYDSNKGYVYGVKKKQYSELHDSDRAFEKGHRFQNISFGESRKLSNDNVTYVSYGKNDNNAYKGKYASDITMNVLRGKPMVNTITLVDDVKIPSQKKAVDTFMELYKSNPEGVSRSIAKARSDVQLFNRIGKIKKFNENRTYKQLTTKGEDWVASKGYTMFNQSLMSSSETKARNMYFDKLIKEGYSGLLDTNDANNGYVKDPIILLTPKTSAKVTKSLELTQRDIEIASARYDWEREKNRDFRKYFGNQYYDAKKEMKRVKKTYHLNDEV